MKASTTLPPAMIAIVVSIDIRPYCCAMQKTVSLFFFELRRMATRLDELAASRARWFKLNAEGHQAEVV